MIRTVLLGAVAFALSAAVAVGLLFFLAANDQPDLTAALEETLARDSAMTALADPVSGALPLDRLESLLASAEGAGAITEITLAPPTAEAELLAPTDAESPAGGETEEEEPGANGSAEIGSTTPPRNAAPAPAVPSEPATAATATATATATEREADSRGATTLAASSGPLPETRLGRIFGSMQPRDAARVLEQMDNRDITTILTMLNDRQAAAVLSNLPPDRAAVISGSSIRRAEGDR